MPFFYKNSKLASLGALFNYDYTKRVAGLKAGIALNTHDLISNSTVTIASDLDRSLSVELQYKFKNGFRSLAGLSVGPGGHSYRGGFRFGHD